MQSSTVSGNAIGIAVGGGTLANAQFGIVVTNNPGPVPSLGIVVSGNGIAHNGIDGIAVRGSASNGDPQQTTMDGGNSIYANTGLGINLQPAGEGNSTVTANDPLDADTGPNGVQKSPAITSAILNVSGGIDVLFTFNSTASTTFRIKAYAN